MWKLGHCTFTLLVMQEAFLAISDTSVNYVDLIGRKGHENWVYRRLADEQEIDIPT